MKGSKRHVVKRDPAWTKREKKVVCDLDNVVGLVVPYEDDIGWRPVNCENAELAKIVRDIEAAKYSGKKINFDALDHLVTLTAYAVSGAWAKKRDERVCRPCTALTPLWLSVHCSCVYRTMSAILAWASNWRSICSPSRSPTPSTQMSVEPFTNENGAAHSLSRMSVF